MLTSTRASGAAPIILTPLFDVSAVADSSFEARSEDIIQDFGLTDSGQEGWQMRVMRG